MKGLGRAVVAGILFLAACEKPKVEPAPLTVTVAPVEARDVMVTRTWVGLLNGYQNADIRAQVTGYLLTQDYKEGSVVRKGDTLFTLDARPFQAALEQAQAEYAQKVAQAQLAQITLGRQAELFKTKVISAQQYDTSYQDTQAAIAAAAAAAANVQAAQVNLDYCTITAPFDGIAGKAQAQIGDLVGPGATSVLTQMSQLDPIKAVFSITETEYLEAAELLQQIERIPIEQRKANIRIRLADGKEWPEAGRYDFINRQVDVGTGTITVEALVPNPHFVLRPGLFVRVTAPLKELKDALVVPQQAVTELQGGYLVSVVDSTGAVETYPVKLGPPDGPDIVVTSPHLSAGMQVVVGGVEKVRPGMKVKTTPFAAPSPSPSPAAS